MKWKTLTISLSAGLLAASIAGFRYSPYAACRFNDLKDTVTAVAGRGFGLKHRVGPIHLGLLKNRDWAGLRGGEWFRQRFDEQGSEDKERIAWGWESCREGYFRGKNYEVSPYEHPLFYLYDFPFISFPKDVPWSYYTQCEFIAGVGGSLRLGINPGEILDWLLGWLGADICRDDYLSMPEYVSCRHITAEGVKRNAERNEGRIGSFKGTNAYDPASAMGIAVARDRVDIAKALVETGVKAVIFPSASPAMAQAMIDMGAEVNASVPATIGVFSRVTPLINVAQQGSAGTIEVLLRHGANVNAADDEGKTALFYAVTRRDAQEKESSCHPEIVKALLDAGAKIDIEIPAWHYLHTKTILGCAIFGSGSSKIVELLLASGADPNSEDALRIAIMAEAYYCGQRDYSFIVKELIKRGARIKSSHLFEALKPNVRSVEIVKALLEVGADANTRASANAGGGTANQPPLIAVFDFSHSEAWLLAGPRPLSKNIRQTLAPVVELLLDHDADPRYPGVMPQARKFLKGTPLLEKMEKLTRE